MCFVAGYSPTVFGGIFNAADPFLAHRTRETKIVGESLAWFAGFAGMTLETHVKFCRAPEPETLLQCRASPPTAWPGCSVKNRNDNKAACCCSWTADASPTFARIWVSGGPSIEADRQAALQFEFKTRAVN